MQEISAFGKNSATDWRLRTAPAFVSRSLRNTTIVVTESNIRVYDMRSRAPMKPANQRLPSCRRN
jgi:hypothetical protein